MTQESQIEQYETQTLSSEDLRTLSVQVKGNFHNIVDEMQPVFQHAWQNAKTEKEQALVAKRWQQLQDVAVNVNAFNEAVMKTVRALKVQRDTSIVELDGLIDQLRNAAQDQRTAPVYETDPDTMELDRVEDAYRKYRAEVAEVVVATEDRVNAELEYERDSFYGEAYPLIAESVIADLTSQIALHAGSDYTDAKALMRLLRTLPDQTTPEIREDARKTLKMMLEVLDES